MIKKMPRRLPTLADMMEDLSATPAEISRVLGVSLSTVYRWLAVGNTPRPHLLALYWVTRWGLSELDAELHNRANLYETLSQSLTQQVRQMERDLSKLGKIGDYGSANDPHTGVRLMRVNYEQTWARPQAAQHATDKHRGASPCLDCGSLSTG